MKTAPIQIKKSLLRKIDKEKGFTLIELLVVIAIIAILAVLVFVALNPVKRFADARNSRRWSDVNSILTAIHEYAVDNDGALPAEVTTTEQELGTGGCTTTGNCTDATHTVTTCTDLSTSLAPYLKSIPIDPQNSDYPAGYTVVKDTYNIVTVRACNAENSEIIEVSR